MKDMKKSNSNRCRLRWWCAALCLAVLPLRAQEGFGVAQLFEKFDRADGVVSVNLSGNLLKAYDLTLYRSLVFDNVAPHEKEVELRIRHDAKSGQVVNRQEIVQNGSLRSAYYELSPVSRNRRKVNRFLLYKRTKENKATVVYVEGNIDAEQLMDILYRDKKKEK